MKGNNITFTGLLFSLGANTIAINFASGKSDLFTTTDDRSAIISDVLIILQQIDRYHSVAYVPYGPELEPGLLGLSAEQ